MWYVYLPNLHLVLAGSPSKRWCEALAKNLQKVDWLSPLRGISHSSTISKDAIVAAWASSLIRLWSSIPTRTTYTSHMKTASRLVTSWGAINWPTNAEYVRSFKRLWRTTQSADATAWRSWTRCVVTRNPQDKKWYKRIVQQT